MAPSPNAPELPSPPQTIMASPVDTAECSARADRAAGSVFQELERGIHTAPAAVYPPAVSPPQNTSRGGESRTIAVNQDRASSGSGQSFTSDCAGVRRHVEVHDAPSVVREHEQNERHAAVDPAVVPIHAGPFGSEAALLIHACGNVLEIIAIQNRGRDAHPPGRRRASFVRRATCPGLARSSGAATTARETRSWIDIDAEPAPALARATPRHVRLPAALDRAEASPDRRHAWTLQVRFFRRAPCDGLQRIAVPTFDRAIGHRRIAQASVARAARKSQQRNQVRDIGPCSPSFELASAPPSAAC
jgi:hypothetical protein